MLKTYLRHLEPVSTTFWGGHHGMFWWLPQTHHFPYSNACSSIAALWRYGVHDPRNSCIKIFLWDEFGVTNAKWRVPYKIATSEFKLQKSCNIVSKKALASIKKRTFYYTNLIHQQFALPPSFLSKINQLMPFVF